MSAELIREDPADLPPGRGRRSPVAAWLQTIRSEPGVWFRYPEPSNNAGLTTRVHNGAYAGIKSGEFEAATRRIDGKRYLYARFIGGSASEPVA